MPHEHPERNQGSTDVTSRSKSLLRGTSAQFTFIGLLSVPYLQLIWLSFGSGWSYPNLSPDRLDFVPWSVFFMNPKDLLTAVLTSMIMAMTVATLSTFLGLVLSRITQPNERVAILLVYLPFLCSPVVVGTCVLDLFIRIHLSSTIVGVFLIQSLFATAFTAILFLEMQSPEIARLEIVVQNLGGSRWDCWRHAIWPKLWRIFILCWSQAFLFSWLDYGLVSTIGGGIVPSITLQVIAYIREASINQAAQASLLLMAPPIFTMFLVTHLLRDRVTLHPK